MFFANPDASVSHIVHTGQSFDVGGGLLKTISEIGLMELAGARDGRGSQINQDGLVTFSLNFTDGTSGIFAAQVPEPSTVAMAIAGAVMLGVVSMRRKRFAARRAA